MKLDVRKCLLDLYNSERGNERRIWTRTPCVLSNSEVLSYFLNWYSHEKICQDFWLAQYIWLLATGLAMHKSYSVGSTNCRRSRYSAIFCITNAQGCGSGPEVHPIRIRKKQDPLNSFPWIAFQNTEPNKSRIHIGSIKTGLENVQNPDPDRAKMSGFESATPTVMHDKTFSGKVSMYR